MEMEMSAQPTQKDPYLDVLQEIKDLMDSRLGDKLSKGEQPPMEGTEIGNGAPMEASPEVEIEVPSMEEKDPSEGDLSEDDKMKLKAMYSKA